MTLFTKCVYKTYEDESNYKRKFILTSSSYYVDISTYMSFVP